MLKIVESQFRRQQLLRWIGKPYTKESLARKIRHVLANEKQRQVAGPTRFAAGGEVKPAPTDQIMRVLLVEDDTDIRDNTRDMLECLGYEVIAVGSAEEALARLALDIQVLVTDQQLPGIQGSDLVQLAKTRFPHLRVLIASGFGSVARLADVNSLPKPYTLEMLRTALQSVGAVV
ncbi:response regulator [Massilia sp. METH4]|uniref:response regulator n=1 Tax=Massilia sp. METH4 TaxID=3123041 RepID=UPI0030CDCE3C